MSHDEPHRRDITVEELAIELFFSGDAPTVAALRARWT